MARSTRKDMDSMREAIMNSARELSEEGPGFTLRQLFYRCSVRGIIDKTEPEYKRRDPADDDQGHA